MTTKFTRGPWSAFIGNDKSTIAVSGPHGVKAPVVHWMGFDGVPAKYSVRVANAYLIAAAPELYDMCQYLLDIFNHETKSVTALDSEKLERLLAKARGES